MHAIESFITAPNNLDKINKDPQGNVFVNASVHFFYNQRELESYTQVHIVRAGYNYGDMRLEENGELNDNYIHLFFKERFQNYKFDPTSSSLIVTGSSDKMNGDYKVVIRVQ